MSMLCLPVCAVSPGERRPSLTSNLAVSAVRKGGFGICVRNESDCVLLLEQGHVRDLERARQGRRIGGGRQVSGKRKRTAWLPHIP